MTVHFICAHCNHVFRLKYEPKDPDEWWCEECREMLTDPLEERSHEA